VSTPADRIASAGLLPGAVGFNGEAGRRLPAEIVSVRSQTLAAVRGTRDSLLR
jgi:hypothetical protein